MAAIACAAATAAPAAAPQLEPRLTKALTAPSLWLGRTAALAVDVASGAVIYANNSSLPIAPASNEKIPVTWVALTSLGAGIPFHTEVYGTGTRAGACLGRRPDPEGLRRPDAHDGGCQPSGGNDRGPRDPHRQRDASSATSRSTTPSVARRAGSRYFIGGEAPPLSALVVDRARGWPALSPPLLAARAFREALAHHGVTVVGRPGRGVTPLSATTLASDVSDPLSAIVRHMNHQSDNFYAEMLLKQLAAVAGSAGTSRSVKEVAASAVQPNTLPPKQSGGTRNPDRPMGRVSMPLAPRLRNPGSS